MYYTYPCMVINQAHFGVSETPRAKHQLAHKACEGHLDGDSNDLGQKSCIPVFELSLQLHSSALEYIWKNDLDSEHNLKQNKTELKQSANCSSWNRDSTQTKCYQEQERRSVSAAGPTDNLVQTPSRNKGGGMRETRTGSSRRSHKGTVALTNSWQSREFGLDIIGHHWTDFTAHIHGSM